MLFAKPNAVWIVLATLFNVFEQNYAAYFRCYRGDFNTYDEVPLASPDSLITAENPCLNVSRDTMVLENGFDNDPDNGPAIKTVISVYIDLQKVNVVLLNWAKESQGIPGLGILGYPIAVKNTKTVGEELGTAILRLLELGLSEGIHLIGHSLGAHIAGYAAQQTSKHNFTIPWITGLDPARPGFQESSPLSKASANFVDIVHSDPDGYGRTQAGGHIDIYANHRCYMTAGPDLQPGCNKTYSVQDNASSGNRCSHDRSWEFYSKASTNPEIFKIARANTYEDWVAKDGQFADEDVTVLGPKIDKTKRGIFYFTTSANEPWGLGDEGLVDRACSSKVNSILPLG